jgi:GntR family transcriptional regulator
MAESPIQPLRTTRSSLVTQTQRYMSSLIQNGAYPPGCQLPAEDELARQLGVSRATLREALLNLERQGVILRRRGVGTFVANSPSRPLDSGLEVLESIDHMAARSGLNVTLQDVEIEERPARAEETRGLAFNPTQGNAPLVLSVRRVILLDAHPSAHLVDVLPCSVLCKDELLGEATGAPPFHGSVLDVLIQRGEPRLAYSYTRLAATTADAELARQLHISRKAPLLKLEARLYSQDGMVVDYSTSHFVPGHFDFHVLRRIA